ncbi:hypothetical protein ABZS66_37410 [Dactylosporangium sp. NPDC005572]|uniref:hypothetical protein n=1 Tax=Dactylosporangium sp. NPDC005572 TaxID=3156889 RepID=UPI0033A63B95
MTVRWLPPEEIPELMAVLLAVQRGTERSKLRLLTIACPRDHGKLGEVFATPAGPVLYGAAMPSVATDRETAGLDHFHTKERRELLAAKLTESSGEAVLQCGNGHGFVVPVGWISDHLAGGASNRRVVWRDNAD